MAYFIFLDEDGGERNQNFNISADPEFILKDREKGNNNSHNA